MWTRSRRTAPAPRSATRSRRRPCWPPTAGTVRTGRCGSARSSRTSGTPQAAAGVAGVIKMVMALRHGMLPRDAARGRAVTARGLGVRRGRAAHRRARVAGHRPSAPGRGVLVRRERHQRARHPGGGTGGGAGRADRGRRPAVVPVLVSATQRRRRCGRRRSGCGRSWPSGRSCRSVDVGVLGWRRRGRTSSTGRRWSAADREELLAGLAALAAGEAVGRGWCRAGRSTGKPVFVFPGQGSQWAGMAVELLDSAPVFAARSAGVRGGVVVVRRTGRCWMCSAARTGRRRWSGSTWCSRRCGR